MEMHEETRQEHEMGAIDTMSLGYGQDVLMHEVMNSEELKEILVNFKSFKREDLSHLFAAGDPSDVSDMMNPGHTFIPNGAINQMILTPATEALPVLHNLTRDLKPPKRCYGKIDDGHNGSQSPHLKKARIGESGSNTMVCPSPVPSIYDANPYEEHDQENNANSILPYQTLYTQHHYEPNHNNMQGAIVRNPYGNHIHFTGGKRMPFAPVNYPSQVYEDQYKPKVVNDGLPRIYAFLVPQEKGRSRNFDYIGGTATEDPNSEYYVYCRGRPTVVPFAVGVENISPKQAKLKVQVVFSKIKNRIPVRCSNHKEGDNTVWRDQLMISTDPNAQSLSYQDGHGFVIQQVPARCDVLFLCRNSCRQGIEKDWYLQFTLLDQGDVELSVRKMHLRVCEVPHRDIIKSKVKFEWNSALSLPERPIMKVLACKEGMQEGIQHQYSRVSTDVFPIYVSGYQSYCEIMQYVSSMELRKKHENPAIAHAAEFMRDWNRATPILSFLQTVCGAETSFILEKLHKKDVRTLGDLYNRFCPDFFVNLHISSALASQLSALYLNWRNIIEYYEMSVSKEVFKY